MSETKTILIVDDDADVLEQYDLALKGQGYDVVQASSMAEAEETLLARRPDLAVLDLLMEAPDAGFVLCTQLKRMYPDVPVMIVSDVTPLTGLDLRPRNAEEQSWVRAEAVLNKPLPAERLRAEVARLLNGGRKAAAH